jgi:vesicle transport protein SEC22
MSLFTLIGRVTDGMPLAGTQEHRPEFYDQTQLAKGILKRLNAHSPARCIIESGSCLFYYIIEDYVCYLVLAERSYPGDLAYRYLDEVQRQFSMEHGAQVPTFSRPYAAVSFGACYWPLIFNIRCPYSFYFSCGALGVQTVA